MSNSENNNSIVADAEGIKIGINFRNSGDTFKSIAQGFANRGIDRIVLCVREREDSHNAISVNRTHTINGKKIYIEI